jgi:hypothetical protein
MKIPTASILTMALLYASAVPVRAEYTLILKNGRRITVESYREEKGLLKFNGLGGEIGISKEQIQEIRKGATGAPGDLNMTAQEPSSASDGNVPPAQEGVVAPPGADQERVREENEYEARLRDLENKIKTANEHYLESVRGNASPEPMQTFSEEQLKTRQDDVSARFKDAQNNPSEPSPVKLLNPSPFTSLPPTVTEIQPAGRTVSPHETPQALTPNEQQLYNLRQRTLELERERERLLNEMKQRNLTPAASNQ